MVRNKGVVSTMPQSPYVRFIFAIVLFLRLNTLVRLSNFLSHQTLYFALIKGGPFSQIMGQNLSTTLKTGLLR